MKPSFNIPLKAGHTTTEFWLVILTGLLATGLSALSMLDVAWGLGAITVITLGYNASRAKLKQVQATGELEALRTDLTITAQEAARDLQLSAPLPPGMASELLNQRGLDLSNAVLARDDYTPANPAETLKAISPRP